MGDGTIDARLIGDWQVFNEALSDTISSLPPRGSKERRLSTYWIDATLKRVREAQGSQQTTVVASGNAYSILVSDAQAIAAFDYGDEDDREAIPLGDFEQLLNDWRACVIEAQRHETREVPERTAAIRGLTDIRPPHFCRSAPPGAGA